MTSYNKFINETHNNELINLLQSENKFLKDELNEETYKLKQIIKVLNQEIESYKVKNDNLSQEIKKLKKTSYITTSYENLIE